MRALNLADFMAETDEAIGEFEKAVGAARDKLAARLTEARGAFLGQGAYEARNVTAARDDYPRR